MERTCAARAGGATNTAVALGGLAPAGGTGSNPVTYFAGMFARADGTWGTAIGRNGYTAIAQP